MIYCRSLQSGNTSSSMIYLASFKPENRFHDTNSDAIPNPVNIYGILAGFHTIQKTMASVY